MSTHGTASLTSLLESGPYASYAYSYPHKTTYRRLEPAVALRDAWARERRDALFLYLHVPFCEMRCGFCNLFTTVGADEAREADYLRALKTQAEHVHAALGAASFARMAVGGGTPTYLSEAGLNDLFDIAALFGATPRAIPTSVETSPQSATTEKLHILRGRGVSRVSIGVQSFVESEVQASGRAQKTWVVEAAIERIRDADFPILNIDLMARTND
jgi:oxygen-independent coproporphyrinogen-3 oxidase